MRVATGVLNEIMAEAVALQQPPSDKGKRLKLYYITAGSGEAADICHFCQRQGADAFLLYKISGK